ncbi:MYB-like transcription factor ETC1 isoform X1 [Lathyrus oleraceus]|uniref:MYB-like transcription factor ETC1 isoform X1 n=1 Tax=Pisum sativum TaxID=3888 RepID=UPI0021D18ED3|nr:MYB-like transcription factor ETC1 isoform X1 [Pisum sativum]
MADLKTSSNNVSADSTVFADQESSQDSNVEFSENEEMLITMIYNLIGERWSLIAGRIPGRTAEEIEKYWNSRYSTSE